MKNVTPHDNHLTIDELLKNDCNDISNCETIIDYLIKLYDTAINGLNILSNSRDFRESVFLPLSFMILFLPFTAKEGILGLDSNISFRTILFVAWVISFTLFFITALSVYRFSLYL